MSASDILNNNIDQCETEIEDKLLKLDIMGYYPDLYTPLKEKFNKLRKDYYLSRLDEISSGIKLEVVTSMTRGSQYNVDMEQNVLLSLRKIYDLASCKQLACGIKGNDTIEINDVQDVLEKFKSLSADYQNEKDELKDYLCSILYEAIKKDAVTNNRFSIIDILNEYKNKGIDFISGISKLYLNEVKEVFRENQTNESMAMVKKAIDEVFEAQDIINLLNAKGIKIEKVNENNTQSFNESNGYKVIPYTDRIALSDCYWSLNAIRFKKHINPLPKDEKDNLKLRSYDLTLVDYKKANLEGVNLSGTNAIVLPRLSKNMSLRCANLEGLDLRGVSFKDVDITDANLEKTGANITGSRGECLSVSSYEDERIVVSRDKITPYQFEQITGHTAFPHYDLYEYNQLGIINNRILRKYDLSCIDFHYESILKAFIKAYQSDGLDFSYTNINIDPQEFTKPSIPLILNLEGVDLRNKDFTGVEEFFAKCNLKGTGANISPKINPTVSPYVIPSPRKTK